MAAGQSNSSHTTGNNNNNNNNNISFGGTGMTGSVQGGPGGIIAYSTGASNKASASGASSGYPYIAAGRDDSDIGVLLGRGPQAGGSFLGLTHTSALCGLLEVEPLHFTLHMASDGTKMERASTGAFMVSCGRIKPCGPKLYHLFSLLLVLPALPLSKHYL